MRRRGPDGERLAIPISDPGKEELREGISKMVQLLAQQASTTSILAMVVETLLTETYTCLFDTQKGFNHEQHERHYLALLFALKSLSSLTEAVATGIEQGISLTRKLWLRHAEALGVQLQGRAKLVLKESPVRLGGALGAAWDDNVARQGDSLRRERDSLMRNTGARATLHIRQHQGYSAEKQGFGVKLNTYRI